MPPPPAIPWRIVLPIGCLAVGFALGYAVRGGRGQAAGQRPVAETREGGYRYINPLLECDAGSELLRAQELAPFRGRVEAFLRDPARFPGVRTSAVYFRELNDGLAFRFGETERFAPASLRKVPLMIAVLKRAEAAPAILDRLVVNTLANDHSAQQNIRPAVTLEPGASYTVLELIRRMIVYSDNNAFLLLSRTLDPTELHATYDRLALPDPARAAPEDHLTVRTYASFFRILYSASYLGKGLSDLALSTLAQAEFRDGLVAGVPAGVEVAHKFGEHLDPSTGDSQLHDCGIVYHPRHPYLLCVMTRGDRFPQLAQAIAGVSRFVYAEVESQAATAR